MSWLFCSAQCPRDLNQVSIPSSANLELYLPFDNDIENYGSGTYSSELIGAAFVESKCNMGLEFDGINDYLEITPTLNLTGDFTISAWIRASELVNPMGIFSIREQCGTSSSGYSLAQLGINENAVSGVSYQVNTHENCTDMLGGDRYLNTTSSIEEMEDYFIAVTVENNFQESRVVKLYVNCQEFETEMSLDFATAQVFDPLIDYVTTIGASSKVDGFLNSFNGSIDEVRVYSEALDQDSLLGIYFQCLPLEVSITDQVDCDQDTTFITIHNTEPNVIYQIRDITNDELLPLILNGNCGTISFGIGPFTESTSLQILAENVLSGCAITLDTIIVVDASNFEFVYMDSTINLCLGDSIFYKNAYISSDSVATDTIYSTEQCDTIFSTSYVFRSYPNFDLGRDTTLCAGEILKLDASDLTFAYEWQDNSTSPIYEVNKSGVYSIAIENDCITFLDDINVEFVDCCRLYIPNVFSPNQDGINDSFTVSRSFENCNDFTNFSLKVLDRWGSVVFEGDNTTDGWDGSINGVSAKDGVYTYVIEYFDGLNSKVVNGGVTLVR